MILEFLRNLLLLPGRLLLFPAWWLLGFSPRRRDVWVFGSWGGYRFADNAGSFFRHCHGALAGKVRVVWISRNARIVTRLREEGYEAHLNWSPGGIAACVRAGVHLFDCFAKDTNFWLGRGALKVNLWSGVPLKTFERDIDRPGTRYYRLFHGSLPERWFLSMMMPWHVERPDLLIATGPETAAITARAFGVDPHSVAVTGYPRNDVLLSPEPPADSLPPAFAESLARGERTFIYLPTFRDHDSGYQSSIDWEAVDAAMDRCGGRFFCKFHPVAHSRLGTRLRRVEGLDRDIDVYPLLRHATALVSDYSSVIFDFMLLDRPIVYYVPDLDEFVRGSRRLNFALEEVAIGPVCRDSASLVAALEAIGRGEGPPGSRPRETVMDRIFSHRDAGSSGRVLAEISARFPDR